MRTALWALLAGIFACQSTQPPTQEQTSVRYRISQQADGSLMDEGCFGVKEDAPVQSSYLSMSSLTSPLTFSWRVTLSEVKFSFRRESKTLYEASERKADIRDWGTRSHTVKVDESTNLNLEFTAQSDCF